MEVPQVRVPAWSTEPAPDFVPEWLDGASGTGEPARAPAQVQDEEPAPSGYEEPAPSGEEDPTPSGEEDPTQEG